MNLGLLTILSMENFAMVIVAMLLANWWKYVLILLTYLHTDRKSTCAKTVCHVQKFS